MKLKYANLKPTRHPNSIKSWILLPLRADLLVTFQYEIQPCDYNKPPRKYQKTLSTGVQFVAENCIVQKKRVVILECSAVHPPDAFKLISCFYVNRCWSYIGRRGGAQPLSLRPPDSKSWWVSSTPFLFYLK